MHDEPSSWKKKKQALETLVVQAIEAASPEAEIDEYQANAHRVTADFLAGKVDLVAYHKATERELCFPGVIKVRTLAEYRYVMECAGFTEEEVTRTLAHENDHRLAVEEIEGARSQYVLLCMHREEGMVFRPSLYTDWPDGVPVGVFAQKLRTSICAPDELSDGDKAMLGNIDPKKIS